jgi:flagellin
LLNGPAKPLNFQVGPNAGETNAVTLPVSNSEQLGTGSLDVTSSGNQEVSLVNLDQAIDTTSSNRADVGAVENSLQGAQDNAAINQENQASARSQLADTNIAQASTNLSSSLLLQHFSLFALQLQADTFALQTQLLAA